MKTVRHIRELRADVARARAAGRVVGFVPTMGFLHEGHLSLVDRAREEGADFIVVSIFVNPTQFGPTEDFSRYPRDEERDRTLLEARGVNLLFAPATEEIYRDGFSTRVVVGGVAEPLEGERRPGHFDGVATVVLKLFNIVQPDLAIFGQKDAQQCAVVSRLVRDLDLPVRIVIGETLRENSGLAMSSRNAYLRSEERQMAPALQEALKAGEAAVLHGETDPDAIGKTMREALGASAVDVDYLQIVDSETFLPPRDFDREILLVGAVRIGRTRLIDNRKIARESLPHPTAAVSNEKS
jgi:pantoate--beta-alanine ligase